jgi:hypothetical protein
MKFTKIPATLIKIATSIAGIIGFIGAIVGIMSYLHDAGGTLSVTMNGKSVENNSTKECVILYERNVCRVDGILPDNIFSMYTYGCHY